jgi:hypothetical protein
MEDAVPVQSPEDSPPPPPEDSRPLPGSQTPHARGMEAILAARRAQIEAEAAAFETPPPPEPAPAPVEEVPPPQQREAAPQSVAPQPQQPQQPQYQPQPQPEQPRVHRIVVRGTQIDLSEADVQRAAAHALEIEAQRRDNMLRAQYEQQQQQPPPLFDRAALTEHVKALQFGDEEAATDALSRMAEEIALRVRPPPQQPVQQVDPNWIADQVYQRVNNVQSLTTALERFQADYQDIVSDEEATQLAALKADRLRAAYEQQGFQVPVEQIMREAADSVRATRARWGGTNPTPSTTPPNQPVPMAPALAANGGRVAVKRATPQAPAASSAPQPSDTPNVRSGITGSQTVEWMRRTRGQPVYR